MSDLKWAGRLVCYLVLRLTFCFLAAKLILCPITKNRVHAPKSVILAQICSQSAESEKGMMAWWSVCADPPQFWRWAVVICGTELFEVS